MLVSFTCLKNVSTSKQRYIFENIFFYWKTKKKKKQLVLQIDIWVQISIDRCDIQNFYNALV